MLSFKNVIKLFLNDKYKNIKKYNFLKQFGLMVCNDF